MTTAARTMDAQESARRSPGRFLVGALSLAAGAASVALLLVLAALGLGPRVVPYQTSIVLSGSMEPLYPVGSLLIAERIEASQLKVGDVVTFARPDRDNELITHRIVSLESTAGGPVFHTRGDANGADDPWAIPMRGVGYRAVADVPRAGFLLAAVQSSQGRVGLVLLGLIAYASSSLGGRRGSSAVARSDAAIRLLRRGDRARALDHLRSAVIAAPTDLAAHRRLGAVLASGGDVAGTVAEYRRFVAELRRAGDGARAELESRYLGEILEWVGAAPRAASS